MEIQGSFTALVTPFNEKNEFDEEVYREIINFQIESGISGIVAVGTTGESATLSEKEHKRVIEVAVDEANGKCKVIAGTGSNNTVEALDYTQHAYDCGADAALLITPYYNKPTQHGLYEHYKTIAEKVDIPIVLYTVPSRTGVNLEPETTLKLSEIRNIVAIKDASGNLNQVMKVVSKARKDFSVLSGDDSLTFPIMCLGGKGVISVASNVAPKLVSELVNLCLKREWGKAKELHYKLYPLFKVLFIETNPSPVKAAMQMLGFKVGRPRLPLVPVSKSSEEKIRAVLRELELL